MSEKWWQNPIRTLIPQDIVTRWRNKLGGCVSRLKILGQCHHCPWGSHCEGRMQHSVDTPVFPKFCKCCKGKVCCFGVIFQSICYAYSMSIQSHEYFHFNGGTLTLTSVDHLLFKPMVTWGPPSFRTPYIYNQYIYIYVYMYIYIYG